MRLPQANIFFFTFAFSVLMGCGSPGVPLPPSLELARALTDLRASRKGEKVYLTWTMPTQTTDRQNLRHGGRVEVCRGIGTALTDCGTPVAQIPFQQSSRPTAGQYTDQLPSGLQVPPTSFFVYAVSILNPYGRSAGLSNQVQVPAAPALPPPTDFRVQLTAQGVELSWNPVTAPEIPGWQFLYRVYRREQGSNKDAIAGEVPLAGEAARSLLDRNFEWEKKYDYRATVVTVNTAANGTEQQVEGDDTASVRVVAHDVFPPATPSGLEAGFSGPGQKPFIDLLWSPNTDPDLAGYNVYRREEGGQPLKLNSDLIKAPAYRDTAVIRGHKYLYSVSAVDVRGNESAPSEEANDTVPNQ
jgi:hypothetical protein